MHFNCHSGIWQCCLSVAGCKYFFLKKLFLEKLAEFVRFSIPSKTFFFDWKLVLLRLSENNFPLGVATALVGEAFSLSGNSFSFDWKHFFLLRQSKFYF